MSIVTEPVGDPEDGPRAGDGAPIVWTEITVDGCRVRSAVAGWGPPALFLHGWGLGPNAYRQAVRQMGLAGCRVYAPAMPGFGGTPELPAGQRSFRGYSAWVDRYLDAVGLDGVSLVAGHSFGGGVATAFVHDHPDRAGALLLVNAIGSPTWTALPDEVRTMMQRPVWDWALYFGTDLLHSTRLLTVFPTLLRDFLPNLVHDPLAMFRTSGFIRRADLVLEVQAIAARRTPVMVAWSDRDGLVPRSAFDDLRRAAGVDGTVVEGSHAWLIADPERFGELALHALAASGALLARPALRAV